MTFDHALTRTRWHLVAHRCELANDRGFALLQWPLGDLALYNDKGAIIAFDNLCPHRGARFFVDPAGNAPALCPYHGWSYRGGQLRIPRPETYRPCDLAAVRLNTHPVAWCEDFLFVSVDPSTDLATQLGGAWPILSAASANIAASYDLQAAEFECAWPIAVENALEPDHVHMVHAATLGRLDLVDAVDTFYGPNSLLTARVGHARTARALDSMARFFDLPHPQRGYFALHLFPFAFLTSTFGYTYALQTFMPSKDGSRTRMRSRVLTAATTAPPAVTEHFFASAAAINRQVFAEDHDICRRIDPGFPREVDSILSTSEAKVRHFRRSLAAARHQCR